MAAPLVELGQFRSTREWARSVLASALLSGVIHEVLEATASRPGDPTMVESRAGGRWLLCGVWVSNGPCLTLVYCDIRARGPVLGPPVTRSRVDSF